MKNEIEMIPEFRRGSLLSDVEKLAALPFLLTNKALEWHRLHEDTFASWQDFVQVFRRRFGRVNFQSRIQNKARRWRQGSQPSPVPLRKMLMNEGIASEYSPPQGIFPNGLVDIQQGEAVIMVKISYGLKQWRLPGLEAYTFFKRRAQGPGSYVSSLGIDKRMFIIVKIRGKNVKTLFDPGSCGGPALEKFSGMLKQAKKGTRVEVVYHAFKEEGKSENRKIRSDEPLDGPDKRDSNCAGLSELTEDQAQEIERFLKTCLLSPSKYLQAIYMIEHHIDVIGHPPIMQRYRNYSPKITKYSHGQDPVQITLSKVYYDYRSEYRFSPDPSSEEQS